MPQSQGGYTVLDFTPLEPSHSVVPPTPPPFDPQSAEAITNRYGSILQANPESIPSTAAFTAGAMTGGAGLWPALLATGAAGGAGSLVRSAIDETPETLTDAGMTAGREAVKQGVLTATGRGMSRVVSKMRPAAESLWKFAAGPGASKTQAREVLERGLGTLRQRNLEQIVTPRSPTGAFLPREVRPITADTFRRGVDRARSQMPGMQELAVGALAGGMTGNVPVGTAASVIRASARPLPASYIAQRLWQAAPLTNATVGSAPQILRGLMAVAHGGEQ